MLTIEKPSRPFFNREPTLFSQARFTRLIVQVMSGLAPRGLESWKVASLVGVKRLERYGLRSISLCPFGLYAHPYGTTNLLTAVKEIVNQLKTMSTISFEWNVRFDHDKLADILLGLGLQSIRTQTQVLPIHGDYETTFASYNATARNLVRRTRREGLITRVSADPKDVSAYYDIHLRLASTKGNYGFIYPRSFFDGLLDLGDDAVFIVAEYKTRIIGGAWFFRDGDSMLYWHSAMELEFSKHSPMYAILDHAIQMAHDEGRESFNFGGSSGIASLEHFKTKWGAETRFCWRFYWHNPVWKSAQKAKSYLRAYA